MIVWKVTMTKTRTHGPADFTVSWHRTRTEARTHQAARSDLLPLSMERVEIPLRPDGALLAWLNKNCAH